MVETAHPPRDGPHRSLRAALVRGALVILALVTTVPLPARPEDAAAAPPPPADGYRIPEDPRELLSVDDEMRTYFRTRIRRHGDIVERIDDVAEAILGEAGLHFTYETGGLYDTRTAFRRRRGNCVTYAMLVVAVAREFGVPAQFNEVEIRPCWSRAGGLVLETRHLNVRVDAGRESYEIDLKLLADLRVARGSARVVADERAFAAIYTNAGVFRLAAGARDDALRLLKLATITDPTYAAAWANLGGAHLYLGETEPARKCYERALVENPGTMAAISGLARIHRDAGRLAAAAKLERRAQHYREQNPYYLLNLAREECAAGRLEEAERHLRKAVRLKDDEPELYQLLSDIARQRGRSAEAAGWARKYARLERQATEASH